MTKRIAAGVLVVGLFSSLLALTGSLVYAESGSISVSSLTPEGGTYTVTWAAHGGCNSALDGSVTKTIPDAAGGDDLILGSFATDNKCMYEFKASYFTAAAAFDVAGEPVAAGVQCAASVNVRSLEGDLSTVPSASVSVDVTDCVTTSDIVVLVAGPSDPDDGSVDNSHHRSAVKARDWLIKVRPNGKGSDGSPETAAAECVDVDGRARDTGRGIPEIKFTLISDGLNARDGSDLSCQYEVSVILQDGFIKYGDTSVTLSPTPNGEDLIAFNLKVAEREIYLVHTVRGDSSGGSVEYREESFCSNTELLYLPSPYLPSRESARGGSTFVPPRILVPLLEGRYDVTLGVAGSVPVASGRNALVYYAVASDGDPCSFGVSVRAVPDNCAVEETRQVVDLVAAKPQNIVEFFYACWPLTETPTG